MKNALFSVLLFVLPLLNLAAQSAYISSSPCDSEDRFGDLKGAGGILVISKHSDLAITVLNAKKIAVTPKGQRSDGLYEYEIVVDRKETTKPKVEVNRRGDINRTSFTASIKPDFFCAYMIEEVAKPITLEDQTAENDAVLDATLAQVDISTNIADLQIECKELLSRGATIKTTTSAADKSIIVKQIEIPIKILNDAKVQVETTQEAYNKLMNFCSDPKQKATDADFDKLEKLEDEVERASQVYAQLTRINVYATGTNQLSIDLSDLKPRSKKRYGIHVLKIIEERHVSECSGMMAEGARLYGIREYAGAQKAFTNALNAKDTPSDLKATIRTNIAQCDSCILYERYALAALSKLKEAREKGEGSQSDVVKWASAGLDYMLLLEIYNPCDFYSERVKQLKKIIEGQPLIIKFTFAKWVNDAAGFHEDGILPNVEIWALYGKKVPTPIEYKNDKQFMKMLSSYNCKQVGTSDEKGEYDITLNRKELPSGLLFRPVGYGSKVSISYKDINNVMRQSEGDYQKRQFRTRMYYKDK